MKENNLLFSLKGSETDTARILKVKHKIVVIVLIISAV